MTSELAQHPAPMADDDNGYEYVEASCHCELNSFAVRFKVTNLPISTDFCHCNTCRHISGELAVEYVAFEGLPLKSAQPVSRSRARHLNGLASRNRSRPGSPAPGSVSPPSQHNRHVLLVGNGGLLAPPIIVTVEEPSQTDTAFDLSDLTLYRPSPDDSRYFCRICSAQLFKLQRIGDDDHWSVAVGVLDETDGILKGSAHIWVGDTLDGGFANHLRSIDGQDLPRYKEGRDSELLPIEWKAPSASNPSDPTIGLTNAHDLLPAHCHCRAIDFALTRPNQESTLPSCAFPDLLYAYNVTHLSKLHNPADQKWWLRSNNTRYLAGYCMCTFCRLTSGFELQSWAFIPRANIINLHTGKQIGLDMDEERPNSLQQYMSSPGRYREFCRTCGANVFSWEAGRSEVIDVSVGLFDAGGARAEGWLEWHKDRISFDEMSQRPALLKGLLEGLKVCKNSESRN